MDVETQDDVIKTVQVGDATLTLIGTAHVSKQSVELVEERIQSGDYDCVAVELCPPRLENLLKQSWWKSLDIYQIFRQKKATLLLINLTLSAYQKRLAEKIGVQAGQEMIRAVALAKERGLDLQVIDRDISTTLHRVITRVSFWQKLKIFAGMVVGIFVGEEVSEQQIEDLKRGDLLHSVVEEFGESLPQFKEVLIDERDEYMTGKLIELAQTPGGPKKILALVGAGHLVGMLPAFDRPPTAERLRDLDVKPPPGRSGYYIGWTICVVVLSLFAVGFMRSPELGTKLVVLWVVINGGLSALGAAMAMAHPLSVVTAFFAAPITSLNPTIGAGMVVGLVESYLRKPRVRDFETLREDISSMKMWWRNGVLRVLLAFTLSSFGSMVGTYLAGASLVHAILG
jgi:pheromone shutdown-related protein TraB